MAVDYLRGSALIHSIQSQAYSRDLIGYRGLTPRDPWPNQARIAVQFVLNYEEGGESHIEHGDAGSEQFLSDISAAVSYPDRHMSMDSLYDYGARAGFWRIHQEFQRRQLPLSIFAVAMALVRNPCVVEAIQQANYDVIAHGQRWLNYQNIDPIVEAQHMDQALSVIHALFGTSAQGWYTGRDSPQTRSLLAEFEQIKYDSDDYGDDLPFWRFLRNAAGETRPHLIIPYSLESNDMKFCSPNGFSTAEEFYQYLKDAFDVLYAEGETAPKMLSIGMHCRILGRPGRFRAIQRFLDYIQAQQRVWICRRGDIAAHWYQHHAPH